MELTKEQEREIERAVAILESGGIVAFPTETVYGLGADADNEAAVGKVFAAKQRPTWHPLIVHLPDAESISWWADPMPPAAQLLAEKFWPGPLTMVVPRAERCGSWVTGGQRSVGLRCPSHPLGHALFEAFSGPRHRGIVGPSANSFGRISPTTAEHVLHDLGVKPNGKVDMILDGGPCGVGVESTVLALAEQKPRLLRPGGVTLEMLQRVVGAVTVDPAVLHKLADGAQAASPGMKYKHYAPKAKVILVKGTAERYREFVNSKKAPGVGALCFDEDQHLLKVPSVPYGSGNDSAAQARELFDALRELDERQEIQLVYARCPEPEGVGMAVYNRLIRAAGFEVITL